MKLRILAYTVMSRLKLGPGKVLLTHPTHHAICTGGLKNTWVLRCRSILYTVDMVTVIDLHWKPCCVSGCKQICSQFVSTQVCIVPSTGRLSYGPVVDWWLTSTDRNLLQNYTVTWFSVYPVMSHLTGPASPKGGYWILPKSRGYC